MSSFLQSFEDVISNFGNQLFGPCIAQRSHIVYVFCKSVSSFSQNLNIRFFHFFCVLLRIYNLQKLMQLKFGGQFILGLKGTKNRVFWTILSWLFWGLILNKSLCNSHCNHYSFAFELWPKMLLTNHIVRFLKL